MGGGGGNEEGCRPRARTGEEVEGAWAAAVATTTKVVGPAPGLQRRGGRISAAKAMPMAMAMANPTGFAIVGSERTRQQRAGRRKVGGGALVAAAATRKVAGPAPTAGRRRRSRGGGDNDEGCRPRVKGGGGRAVC